MTKTEIEDESSLYRLGLFNDEYEIHELSQTSVEEGPPDTFFSITYHMNGEVK